ncbi:MAG: sulfatase-like hydrolase/transferase [Verrucomicrobia bacterium]|nr:sulfatase-like hydrolase/transferase [Verrucomicrobiota bacterium]
MLPRIKTSFFKLLERRHGGVLIFLFLFVAVALVTRVALLVKSSQSITPDVSLLAAFGWGLVFDLGASLLFATPAVLLLALLPARFFEHIWARALAHIALFLALGLCLFGAVSEWVFWDEFSARFNFIAVDYLVYTHEVIDNIRESYPMPWIFAGLLTCAALLYTFVLRTGWIGRWLDDATENARQRWLASFCWFGAAAIFGFALSLDRLPSFNNNYHRELAKNGVWSLFAAFQNNELDYDQFYATLPIDTAFKKLHTELSVDGSRPLGNNPHDTLRYIRNEGPEQRLNVIQITVESLSANFLSTFNPASRLTPELEALASKSLVFDNFYATGTRTDRGMEALTLSIPPTPGRSLVKRPHNENLFTLGSIFRSRGYDTAFVYGGFGYFDNMNYFFGNNGYRVVDRALASKSDITFANAWGACDEDLYRWSMREADRAYAEEKPFFHFVMTTSNHRPYTYPEGKIDLPSKISGRSGAVKYTDFAIGQFIREASTRPWFKNTIFVIVADHCASSAGKTELPVQNYHIPLFIYTPGGQIAPGRIADLTSQVDYAPTLLGLLNWSYPSRFFGWDVRKATGDRRALIGNYQRLGLYEPGKLTVLKPLRGTSEYNYDASSFTLSPRTGSATGATVDEAIAYYQSASYLYKNKLYREITPTEAATYTSPQTAGL